MTAPASLPEDDDYRGRLDPRVWRRLAGHARPYVRPLGGLGAAGLVVAGVDTAVPFVTGRLIDAATAGASGGRLLAFGAVYAALFLLLAGAVWVLITLAGRISTGVAHDLRRAAFARLQELSFGFYDVRPVGWLVTRLTSDCSKLSSLLPWFLLDLVWGSSLVAGIAVAMLWLDARLGLLVLGLLPPLVVVSLVFQRKLLASSRLVRKTASQLTASFNEELMGARTTKALGREAANLAEFQGLSGAMAERSLRVALQSAVYLPLVITIGSAGVGLALAHGGARVEAGGLTLGTLIAFMQYAALFYMPVRELAARFTELQGAQAAAERVQGLLDTEPEVRDSAAVRARLAERAGRPRPPGVAEDGHPERISRIELRGVGFAYKEGEPVLDGFDLTIEAGQTVALVGSTGSGKSTIANLIARFYEPTAGQVRFDGVDYRERSLGWLQRQLGVVLQTPHLFSGTVRENIRYGRLDATDAEVEQAARRVAAHGFITGLEGGYEADVGEGGGRLSTGQRQLVSLARAVLADPQVMVMDEATSSVDTETERLIQEAVEAALAGRIAVVIAHRLSTIRSADRILVIERGRIVEEGSHEHLLARRGRYHALYTRQFAAADAVALAT